MNRDSETNQSLNKLAAEIDAMEQSLRSRFTATPAPDPATIQRIKARLHNELANPLPATSRPFLQRWFRPAASMAAAILLAVGLYTISRPNDQPLVVSQTADASAVSLDTFTASLPDVLSDEDKEITQFRSDLAQLEDQLAGNAADTTDVDDSSAQRALPAGCESIAAGPRVGVYVNRAVA